MPPNKSRLIGTQAGCITKAGYRVISIGGVVYRSGRLAWFYIREEWPKAEIDHRDTNRANDVWTNLREATRSQNEQNTKKRSIGRSGLKGAIWSQRHLAWISRVTVNGKRVILGTFSCPAASHFAYLIAADKHYGEFARGA